MTRLGDRIEPLPFGRLAGPGDARTCRHWGAASAEVLALQFERSNGEATGEAGARGGFWKSSLEERRRTGGRAASPPLTSMLSIQLVRRVRRVLNTSAGRWLLSPPASESAQRTRPTVDGRFLAAYSKYLGRRRASMAGSRSSRLKARRCSTCPPPRLPYVCGYNGGRFLRRHGRRRICTC